MASIFTYDPDPPRVSSPWSTSGSSTPQITASGSRGLAIRTRSSTTPLRAGPDLLSDYGISKLEPEPQEGPTEYKLHLLLRPRRQYLSMSTGNLVAGSYHHRVVPSVPASISASPGSEPTPRPMQAKSSQSRQQRLQGLTTQLLWRLQQSSPFHSSTTSNLVIPVLPEATPKLGVPSKPARLLPGLEESQGALYEIGVADDGTFVGLTQDEMDESVTNLQAMAASLGCKVEILRRVVVGQCEWAEDYLSAAADPVSTQNNSEGLWVAEALVSPDLDYYSIFQNKAKNAPECAANPESGNPPVSNEDYSHTEQIRISLTGPSTAGKSSLLGTLTSSALDNGRGKSRLSLLKHRHEISSGITSSVAQELIGYTNEASPNVINYASGNVAAWDDIHAASKGGRLAFVSDLPGSIRYLKSTLRGLVSWAPHYVMLCIPANCGDEISDSEQAGNEQSEIETCLAYLELCLKLEVPVVIVITKLDLASRSGLRDNLARVLSALKSAGRQPAMLPASPAGDKSLGLQQIGTVDSMQAQKAIATAEGKWAHTVPIILTSAVDGSGIGKLHAFLRSLPIPARPFQRTLHFPRGVSMSPQSSANIFDVDEVFAIPPSKVYSIDSEKGGQENRGMVLCGLVRRGGISIGDEMVIGPILVDTSNDQGNEAQAPGGSLSRSGPGPSGDFPASLPQSSLSGKDPQAKWQRIRVVSVRDLRLPVRRLVTDQVGTIGIEPIRSGEDGGLPHLGRIRKGMVLTDFHASASSSIGTTPSSLASGLLPLPFHTGFTATFPSTEFSAPNSPPLLLGGNAIAYFANVRTTVRVICMALTGTGEELSSEPTSPSEPELFSFDGDAQSSSGAKSNGNTTNGLMGGNNGDWAADAVPRRPSATDISKVNSGTSSASMVGPASSAGALKEDVKITFALVSSVEWLELGLQIIVMPGTSLTSASSQSGATVASAPGSGTGSGAVSMSGLEGFIGTICDVVPGRAPACDS
jgi:GTPase